jgi:hypothetical protein
MMCPTFMLLSLRRIFLIGLVLPLLLFSTGCNGLWVPGRLSDVPLTIRITPLKQGIYEITGEARLPKNTEITVAAVRYLSIDDSPDSRGGAAAQLSPTPTYSILAYQSAKVAQGKWQTQLNLWQVADDGKYQESWQLEQARLELSLQPSEKVMFLATLTPAADLSAIEQQLARRGLQLASGSVRSTPEGQRYAQVNQFLAIALPTGNTVPPTPRAEEANYGWGDRYLIPQEPQNPYDLQFPGDRQTSAPSVPDEFLR